MVKVDKQRVTLEHVQGWFKAAWPNQDFYPSETHCYSVATAINVVRDSGGKATPRPSVLGAAHSAARKFLKEAPSAQTEIEFRTDGKTTTDFPAIDIAVRTGNQVINGSIDYPLLHASEKLREAVVAIEALLAVCEPIPWQKPMTFIAECTKRGWHNAAWDRSYYALLGTDPSDSDRQRWYETEIRKVSLGKNSEKLARVVFLALIHIGLYPVDELKESTVLGVIRGHERGSSTPGPKNGNHSPGGRQNTKTSPA